MEVGFLVDRLTALMMVVVTFVSLMVHVYTIGYMHDDPGYTRFFSYISLFTFAMLMLVMANNFLQLFFGWEAVGLVSYLLIGFWYTRPTAIVANMKAFLVNRVGDFGFLLGIAGIVYLTGTLDYADSLRQGRGHRRTRRFELFPGVAWSAATVICICLFVGAMGKSAQVPLHVWLPDSMEGPTPISALIHAATMVTAGIFMVARMSPLFEQSETALSFVIVIGATTALFMGFLGIVANDIKRVVAYSTLSQLGYMTVALGAVGLRGRDLPPDDARLLQGAAVPRGGLRDHRDAPRAGHAQDGRPAEVHAGHLLDLPDRHAGADRLPGLLGLLLEGRADRGGRAVRRCRRRDTRYFCVLIGVFVTALYTFRLVFMVFHGKERMDEHTREHLHESPWVVTVPLVAARDPVGHHRLADDRAAAVRRLLPATAIVRCCRRTTCSAASARISTARAAFVLHGLALAVLGLAAGRRHARLVPVPQAPGAGGDAARAGRGPLHAAGQQVLLRLPSTRR